MEHCYHSKQNTEQSALHHRAQPCHLQSMAQGTADPGMQGAITSRWWSAEHWCDF